MSNDDVSSSSASNDKSDESSESEEELNENIRTVCINLAAANDIDDEIEDKVHIASQSRKDPLIWYLCKILFLVSLKNDEENNSNQVDINISLVDKSNWSEQLAMNLPKDKLFIKNCTTDRIPDSLMFDSRIDIIKKRYKSLGFDNTIVNDIILGILSYSYFIAFEAGIPFDIDNRDMRRIIREKHVMILASIENDIGGDKLFDTVSDKLTNGFDLAFMTRRQLLPKYHEKRIENQVKRQAAEDANIIDPKDLEDGFYECDRCGKNKTTFESRQLRSADEPATTFITCHLCRFTWKEN
jgi:DNA-directed RNA polymerase subunit M/transcription elongation factor TFIIS